MNRFTIRYSSTFASVVALAVSVSAQALELPVPDGNYPVGVVRAEFVDPSRLLEADDAARGPRRLPAIVWYPAAQRTSGDTPYMPADSMAVTVPAIARNFGYAADELQHLTTLRLDVHSAVPPAQHPEGFPVVVYSHGFFLFPEQNSLLAMRLASHGYIVVSIAHPGDAADILLEDGRVIATNLATSDHDARLSEALAPLVGGTETATHPETLVLYAESLVPARLGRSLAKWRDDTLAVSRAILDGNEPDGLNAVLAAADRKRLAFVGMSFGGNTSATTCRLVDACRAAVNLDGQNFDPELFGQSVGRPLLLMLSDWTRYIVLKGQPQTPDFSPNDLAYEFWSEAGETQDVVRVRLEGIRHMGFTDLVALLEGPDRDKRVGVIDPGAALSAIGDLVLAFLDAYVRGEDTEKIDHVIERHSALVRHSPARLQGWMDE